MKETRYELMSTLAARSALEGYKAGRTEERARDMSDEEYEMYEARYAYWSKPENHGLAVRAAK